MATAANGVPGATQQRQHQADGEKKDPDHQADVSEGESRNEAREEEPHYDEDDANTNTGEYLISVTVRVGVSPTTHRLRPCLLGR